MDRITEKKLKNKRFLSTEKTIIITTLSAKESLSLSRFISLSKISRSTFYRHHKNLQGIAPDYEALFLKRCRRATRPLHNSTSQLKSIFTRLLIFLLANRMYIELILKKGNHNFIEQILLILKPTILATSQIKDGEMFSIYAKEVAGLIEAWCEAGFSKKTLFTTVNKIIYLTTTANLRLSPLASFDKS